MSETLRCFALTVFESRMSNEDMKKKQFFLETSDISHGVTQHLILKKTLSWTAPLQKFKIYFWQDIMMNVFLW
jgi:hypothetical protein